MMWPLLGNSAASAEDRPPPAFPTELRLLSTDGSPLSGASVELRLPASGPAGLGQLMPALTSGKTDSEGQIPFPLPRTPDALLWVDAPEHAPYALRLPYGTDITDAGDGIAEQGILRLAPGTQISGRLEPVPVEQEAEICARWQHQIPGWGPAWRVERCAPVGDGGRYRLPGLPYEPGIELKVEVQASGWLPWRRTLLSGSLTAKQQNELHIILEPGRLALGRVIDVAGHGVAGVQLESDDGAIARSDSDGSFRIALQSLPTALTLQAPGWSERRVQISLPLSSSSAPLQLGSFVLRPGQRVRGTLLSSDGSPLTQGTLVARQRQGSTRVTTFHEVEPDTDGTFEVELPQPGQYRFELRCSGYLAQRLGASTLASGDRVDLGAVVLDRGASVSGRVADAVTLEPVSGALVELLPRGTALFDHLPSGELPRGVSDSRGDFQLSGLTGGRYELRIWLDGHAPEVRTVMLSPGQQLLLDWIIPGPGVAVEGRLVDDFGQPRGGASIAIYDPGHETLIPLLEGGTDPAGRFGPLYLSPGRYRLEASSQRLLLAQDLAVDADRPVELHLVASGGPLQGRLLRHGQSVGPGTLTLTSAIDPSRRRGKRITVHQGLPGFQASWGTPESQRTVEVGEPGTFAIDDVPPGALWLEWQGEDERGARRLVLPEAVDGGLGGAGADAAMSEGALAPQLIVDLSGSALSGRVTDPGGAPLAAELRVLTEDGRLAARQLTTTEGGFLIEDLPTGRGRLSVRADGYREIVRDLDLPQPGPGGPNLEGPNLEGSAPWLELVLEPASGAPDYLDLRLLRDDGSPMAHTLVTLLDGYGLPIAALPADGEGRRRFSPRAAQEVFVLWDDPWAGVGSRGPLLLSPLLETPGEEISLQAPAGGTLALRCDPTRCGGGAVHWLSLINEEGLDLAPYLSGTSCALALDDHGRLTLGRVAPGSYELELWTARGRFARPITVTSGQELTVELR